MSKICFYFQLHQPYRLSDYSIFDLGKNEYFSKKHQDLNKNIFHKVAQKSYLPMLSLLLELAENPELPHFSFSVSCSGVFLEQAQAYEPKVIELLQKLVSTGKMEILSETYYHSLASLYSPTEFYAQVTEHKKLVKKLFKYEPKVFRNTELIYSNQVAKLVQSAGFLGMLTEGVDRYLHGRSRAQVFQAKTSKFSSKSSRPLFLLLKHAQLSDDVAFRFSDKNWAEHPLSAEKYLQWFNVFGKDEIINLFMDFETFGEHQWADTGIFDFFRHFVQMVEHHSDQMFVTPRQLLSKYTSTAATLLPKLPIYDVPEPISWADVDRDLTAWRGNPLQNDTLRIIYHLEHDVLTTKDPQLIQDWRRLQTSDHFYYMCVKWSSDGDVHKYFSPYDSPFDAYNRYSTVLADLHNRVARAGAPKKSSRPFSHAHSPNKRSVYA